MEARVLTRAGEGGCGTAAKVVVTAELGLQRQTARAVVLALLLVVLVIGKALVCLLTEDTFSLAAAAQACFLTEERAEGNAVADPVRITEVVTRGGSIKEASRNRQHQPARNKIIGRYVRMPGRKRGTRQQATVKESLPSARASCQQGLLEGRWQPATVLQRSGGRA